MQSSIEFLGILAGLDWTAIAIYSTIVIIALVVIRVLLMLRTLIFNQYVGASSKLFPRTYNTDAGMRSNRRILIVGDSTAVGTGALQGEDTIAARLARDFPDTGIINIAKNGTLTRDVLRQLRQVNQEHFDMILISTGGNDMWNISNKRKLRRDLCEILQLAKNMTEKRRVFLLLYSNMGSAPLFPAIFRWMIARNCAKVQRIFRDVATFEQVPCIELFTEKNPENPFLSASEGLFASDGIHPSSEGYRIWYNRFWRLMVEQGHHFSFVGNQPTH